MGYRHLAACINDLARTRQLIRIEQEIDPHLEAAEIQRRVYRAGGPAVYFARVKGTPFPMVSNLFGTLERARFLFRDTLETLRKLVELKCDPSNLKSRPWRYWSIPFIAGRLRPKFVRSGPILAHTTVLSRLPQLKSWPRDGGAFVTMPQVYTEHPDRPGWRHSNLGMYRVQLSGNNYLPDRECGLHYQIHRGIGIHHSAALRRDEPLAVNIVIGGPPALALAAVMPLPEGMPELAFAGVLGGQRVRMVRPVSEGRQPSLGRLLPFPAEADFLISGYINPTETKPEGPFGDHLGYYSLTHDFPLMHVTGVYHRPGAVWPFTVVGRPPQEDTTFGELIHELTGPVIPTVIPGVHAVHAVDASGVHPLLLAIGSERYVPFGTVRKPQELLTLANAILGQGQLSLAKYLLIAAKEDAPDLKIHDIPAFLRHVLERFEPQTDLHFQTRTTIDTLDYSAGMGLNAGSKVVIAAAGPPRRSLATTIPADLKLPHGFTNPRVVIPGILAIGGPSCQARQADPSSTEDQDPDIQRLIEGQDVLNSALRNRNRILDGFPLITVVDDSDFAAANPRNWLWLTFTRSDPANDVYGVEAFTHRKHWGCRGSVVIDARMKPYMAPPLEEDPLVSKRVDALFARGGPLYGVES